MHDVSYWISVLFGVIGPYHLTLEPIELTPQKHQSITSWAKSINLKTFLDIISMIFKDTGSMCPMIGGFLCQLNSDTIWQWQFRFEGIMPNLDEHDCTNLIYSSQVHSMGIKLVIPYSMSHTWYNMLKSFS